VTNLSGPVVDSTQYARVAMDKSALGMGGKSYLKRGIMHASGRAGRADLVAAHKWFNLAAMRGNAEAARLRSEITREMMVRAYDQGSYLRPATRLGAAWCVPGARLLADHHHSTWG
jgi:TPR repeat protein